MRSLSLSCCFVKSRAEIDSVVEALLPLTNNDITKILATVEKFPSGLHTSKGNRFAVSKIDLHRLLHHVQTIFRQEETLITLPPKKYIIVGDIHGQIYDLLHIFRTYGRPPHLNYIFLGDYVDRGPHSLEVLTFLLCFKALYPQNIYLIRGNHETEEVSKIFGFRLECEARISPCTWSACVNIFNTLPLAIVIEEPVSVFCVHGGISPHIPDLDTIRNSCHRPCNITDSSPSLLVDLLWADPCNTLDMWSSNRRGRSYEFGIEAARYCGVHCWFILYSSRKIASHKLI